MRILCVCDEGNSRSPTIASILRYSGHDTLSVGVNRAQPETIDMLAEWADMVILTDEEQSRVFVEWPVDGARCEVWPIPDAFPRPFHPQLAPLVKQLVKEKGLA